MKAITQISDCLYTGHRNKPKIRGYLKKQVHRARRRAERRDPENAPARKWAYVRGVS